LLLLVAGVFFACGLAGPGVVLTAGLLTTGCVYLWFAHEIFYAETRRTRNRATVIGAVALGAFIGAIGLFFMLYTE
jgi:hypothetical protein